MADAIKALVLGNCQAQMLEGILALAARGLKIERFPPVFELSEKDRDRLTTAMQTADHIFLQRVSEDYVLEWLRPSRAREAFPGKVTVWPNIYFNGYFPDVEYIYTSAGKLQGPLDDYHMRGIRDAHQGGQSVTAARRTIPADQAERARDAFLNSIAQLTAREANADIRISDFITERARTQRCFYTPNHPCNAVLVEMARRLAAATDLPFDAIAAEKWGYKLDKIHIPVYPAVIRSEGIVFDEPQLYRGVAVAQVYQNRVRLGGDQIYTLDQLIDTYYRLYDVVFTGTPDVAPSNWRSEAAAPSTRFVSTADTFIKARPIHSLGLTAAEKVAVSQGMVLGGHLTREEQGHLRLKHVTAVDKELPPGGWFIFKDHWKEVLPAFSA